MNIFQRGYHSALSYFKDGSNPVELAAPTPGQPIKQGKYMEHDLKSVFQTRIDIKNWRDAEAVYYSGDDPKTYPLQLIIADILKDALLSSQKENRLQQIFSLDIRLKKPGGEVDTEQSEALKKMPIYRFLTREMLNSDYYEYSVVELSLAQTVDGRKFLVGDTIPRTNIVPITGQFYPDYSDSTKSVSYREMKEYGVWILEFWSKEMPLLNKAVPHVLFKRFAQSCWSELCEIYGIPPRVLKTNTQDKTMMARAQKMLKDMGAASWFIIDEDEEFEFAQGATTNGDVYNNLITLCNNEICLLIVGAILAQDTKNGSRSKDEVAMDLLGLLVEADKAKAEEYWNNIGLPALKKHGLIKGDVTFEYVPVVNIQQLFDRCIKTLEYYEIDPAWFAEQFGIKITGIRKDPIPSSEKKKLAALLNKEKPFFA